MCDVQADRVHRLRGVVVVFCPVDNAYRAEAGDDGGELSVGDVALRHLFDGDPVGLRVQALPDIVWRELERVS